VLLFLHILVVVICALECFQAFRDVQSRFFRLLVFSSLGVVHGFAPALRSMMSILSPYSDEDRLVAAAQAFVGILLLSLGWRFYDAIRPTRPGISPGIRAVLETPQGQRLLRRLFWACAVLGIIGWLGDLLMRGVPLSEIFTAARFTGRGYLEYRLTPIQYFRKLLMVPGLVGFFINRKYRIAGVIFAITMAVLFFATSVGTRGLTLGVLGGSMMGYLVFRGLSARRVLIIGSVSVALAVLTIGSYKLRHGMRRMTAGEMVSYLLSSEPYRDALQHDALAYHEMLVAAVHLFPDHHPYLNGATYRRMLFFYVPHKYYPRLKPLDTDMVFGAMIVPRLAHAAVTVPPTMMGDLYINFWGWPGIIGMFLWGLLLGYIDCKYRTNVFWHIAMGSAFLYLWLFVVRGAPYNALFSGVFIFAFLWLFGRIICFFSFRDAKFFVRNVEAEMDQQMGLLEYAPST